MSLTPRERVLAQINHQETDAIPYTIGFEGDVKERLDDHYGSDAWRDLVDPAIRGVTIPSVGLLVDLDHGDTYTDLFGSTWRVDRRPMRLIDPPLKEPTLDGYEFPDADACFEPDWEPRVHQAIEELEGHFLVIGIGFGLFERTWTVRGFTEALMDAAANPGFYDELVEQVANQQLAILDRLLDLPVDGVMFSDDWGYQDGVLLGPERWRRFVRPVPPGSRGL